MLLGLARSALVVSTTVLLLAAPAAAEAPQNKAKSADVKDAAKVADRAKKSDPKKPDAKKPDASAKVTPKDDAKKADPKKPEPKKADAKKADASVKVAKKDDPKKADAKTDDIKGPASIGAPNKGRLLRGVKLHSSRSLKVREHSQAWGLPALVKLLQRAAGKVAKHHPKSVMLIGDLSQKSGGPMTGHNSHQSGRDADVGFYIANSHGKPAAMTRFVAFEGTGKSAQVAWAQFDDERNWTLVEALITDKDTPVRYIFVSMPLRARVLAFAKKAKVAKDVYLKAETALMAPRDADVHDDHFHVRIACPESMRGYCTEESSGRVAPGAIAKASKTGDSKPATGDSPKTATGDGPKTADAADTVYDAPKAP